MSKVEVSVLFTPEQIKEALISYFNLPLQTDVDFVNVKKYMGYGAMEEERTIFEGAKAMYKTEFKTNK